VFSSIFEIEESVGFIMFKDFTTYDDCEPAGVELPQTPVDKKTLDKLGLKNNSSNYEIVRKLCYQGMLKRGLEKNQEYIDRVKFELTTLDELGFIDYILLNWDVINFCHDNDIPVGGGRGSAAGSLVLYLLGVTDIDPIPHGLFFERFVSKSRARKVTDKNGKEFLVGSVLPDIDNDISYEKRSKVIDYIEKTHAGRTAKILTFNTFSSKLCIREATKYFDEASEEEAKHVSDLIPKLHGKVLSLKKAREESEKFDEWCSKHKTTIKYAIAIEDLIKNTGVHPSGIAICSQEIENVVPLQRTKDGDLVTGYNMHDVADLMVKFDILGLRTLTIAHKTCQKIGKSLEDIDPNDNEIYRILQDFNHPMGLFQISADTNFQVCQDVKPMDLNELSDVVALARPSSLQFVGDYIRQKTAPEELGIHPVMDELLRESKNVFLYQETLMQCISQVFGFSLQDADDVRRIVGKKLVDKMQPWKEKIYKAAEEKGMEQRVADFFWTALEAAANYSFNKSHSFAYATLAAKTVYLKYKHPQEFFLSVLEAAEFEPDPLQTISSVNQELSDFGIKLLPPDLFKSGLNFQIEGDNIRYGLNSIKGISMKALESLVAFRGHSFENKYHAFTAAKECGINISVLAALIQAGTMDSNTDNRIRLVLEAQAFNILTDREKRNFEKIGEKYNFDILDSIADAVEKQVLADDGRPIMKPSRFTTFKNKFNQYRSIYNENKKHHKFTYWWYENSLLGYSYSFDLTDCFTDQYGTLTSLKDANNLSANSSFKAVFQVKDCFTRTSRNGNKYMMIFGSDNTSDHKFLLMDNRNSENLTEFLEDNKKSPLKKEDIVVIFGRRSDNNTSFAESVKIINSSVLMKLGDLKKHGN
jgi:DNA polymerase-3 subunit alpha